MGVLISAMREPNRLYGIELLRFVCALVIVLWHYQHFFLVTDVNNGLIDGYVPSRLPGFELLSIPYTAGGHAVEAFWLISGFIFFWKYADSITSRMVSWQSFFVFRFSRLYPLHIATLLLVATLQYVYYQVHGFHPVYPLVDSYHFVLNLFMASGWGLEQDFSFNGPIWSVSAEEIIYASFFVLAFRFQLGVWRALVLALGCYVGMRGLQWAGIRVGAAVMMCGSYYFLGGAIERIWTMLPASVRNRDWFAWMGPTPQFLGNLTYSSYLLHFPIMLLFLLVSDGMGWSREIYYDWRVWLAYLITVFASSRLVYVRIERPAQSALRGALIRKPVSRGAEAKA